MKAMILAAGLGTRLRPLTLEIAKPAAPLLGKPLVARLIERLLREGVTDFRLNLHHIPDSVEAVFRKTPWDALPVSFSHEPEILGTAGGLKANESFFSAGTFVMANADIVMDFSLREAFEFHSERAALATMILYRQQPPFRYFPVRIDLEGHLRDFKGMCPGGDLRPETYVFTGVHILEPRIFEYIPRGRFCEINDEVYTAALARGEGIYGYPVTGYWNDLGDPTRYLAAHRDLLLREISCYAVKKATTAGAELGSNGSKSLERSGVTACHDKTSQCRVVENPAVSKGPVFISADAHVAESALIGPFVSVGSGCVIEPGATVQNSVLWDNVRVKSSAVVRDCIVGSYVTLEGNFTARVITRYGEAAIV
jgi:mannose-1-phosphate guanylyltransferase